jgi:hypothetical protein
MVEQYKIDKPSEVLRTVADVLDYVRMLADPEFLPGMTVEAREGYQRACVEMVAILEAAVGTGSGALSVDRAVAELRAGVTLH